KEWLGDSSKQILCRKFNQKKNARADEAGYNVGSHLDDSLYIRKEWLGDSSKQILCRKFNQKKNARADEAGYNVGS
ncbi:hypothetical protein ACLXAT_27170, partial [Escherichia coli]